MKLHRIVRYAVLIVLGACLYGFIGAALDVYAGRVAGNVGGEAFVIPLFIGLVWLGWELRGQRK